MPKGPYRVGLASQYLVRFRTIGKFLHCFYMFIYMRILDFTTLNLMLMLLLNLKTQASTF